MTKPTITPSDSEKRAAALDAAIEHWLSAHVRNGPVARETDAWNALVGSLPHLKQIILEET